MNDVSVLDMFGGEWVNATEIAKPYGSSKRPVNWLTSRGNFISRMADEMGFSPVHITSGRNGRTMIHRSLLPDLYMWLDLDRARVDIAGMIRDADYIIKALQDFEVPDDLPDMFVYAIREAETGNVKLGISRDPERRIKELQIGNSNTLELVATRRAENRFKDEKALHIANADKHIHGEWFTGGAELSIAD